MYEERWSGWRSVFLVSITYVYFLIFAQFAFLKRLADFGIADAHLKAVMGAMAAGGIFTSLLAPRITLCASPALRLRIALGACAAAAFFTAGRFRLVSGIPISLLIGAGLGLLTVTLVTHLRLWTGYRNSILKVGLGTGVGYFVCNFPPLFTASPRVQAVTSGILCLAGVILTLQELTPSPQEGAITQQPAVSFLRVLACFTALVWLDSAAFFIIQNTPALKAGTWGDSIHLWLNGVLHFAAALASVWCLRRRGLSFTLSTGFLALASACLLLHLNRLFVASVFYPVGVSLYSVALVAYPSMLAPAASLAERGRQAGWIYAIAGWFGSAMGIGMGQNLGHIPLGFVGAAGAVILMPDVLQILRRRSREFGVTAAILLGAFCMQRAVTGFHGSQPPLSRAELGRQVYISEGCINCHSQYVRPNTPDVLLWGPVQTVEELRRDHPPLIGNRRQGPDLSEVGSRRSPLWLKAHLYQPWELSHGSFMPSYAYLFKNSRGDDLIAYLTTLQGSGISHHLAAENGWHLSSAAVREANTGDGAQLFHLYCSTCHDANGSTRNTWRTSFRRLPPDLAVGPFRDLPVSGSAAQLKDRLAQITKFGIYETDMPGHEYLSDKDIASISLWLANGIEEAGKKQQNAMPPTRPIRDHQP